MTHVSWCKPEELQLGVQLRVAGHDVLILLVPELPGHRLLGHPELVLDLVQGRVLENH